MIATVRKLRETPSSDCREQFLALLSPIKEQARFAFRNQPFDRRQELVAEVIANAFVAFKRLVEHGLSDMVYARGFSTPAITPRRRYSSPAVEFSAVGSSRAARHGIIGNRFSRRPLVW